MFVCLTGHFGTLTRRSVHPTVSVLHTSKHLETSRILPKNANILSNHEKKESQQHPVFPGGHPSKYWLGSMLLNFSDRTRTGVFNMIWPLARIQENFNTLFQQQTYIHTYIPTYTRSISGKFLRTLFGVRSGGAGGEAPAKNQRQG